VRPEPCGPASTSSVGGGSPSVRRRDGGRVALRIAETSGPQACGSDDKGCAVRDGGSAGRIVTFVVGVLTTRSGELGSIGGNSAGETRRMITNSTAKPPRTETKRTAPGAGMDCLTSRSRRRAGASNAARRRVFQDGRTTSEVARILSGPDSSARIAGEAGTSAAMTRPQHRRLGGRVDPRRS
jgi:hypothetical protein